MRRFLRIAGIVVGSIVTIALIALVVLLQGPAVPDHSDYQLDLATLRKLADQPAGAHPIKTNAAEVAHGNPPAAVFLGGVRFDRHEIVFPAYQVHYTDGSMVIVDAPPRRAFFEAAFPGSFDDAQYKAERRQSCQGKTPRKRRSEEHTSELQSPDHLVCRLLL